MRRYERKDATHPFRAIIDLNLFAAMGPPGGGRSFITPRMVGHFFMVGFVLRQLAALRWLVSAGSVVGC